MLKRIKDWWYLSAIRRALLKNAIKIADYNAAVDAYNAAVDKECLDERSTQTANSTSELDEPR